LRRRALCKWHNVQSLQMYHHKAEVLAFCALTRCCSVLQSQKKRVEDMIAEEATIDGLENVECKVFK
jgi:hypothetical protein